VSATSAISARCSRIAAAPSAQLSRRERAGVAHECQKAVGVWPDSVRPERSVIVPEIISGRRTPLAAKVCSQANTAAWR